jgi:L-threonine-O-3-phosphate decarboxylase
VTEQATRPEHGGAQARELRALGLDPREALDFSANINPLGPPPAVLQAIRDADYSRYPDPDCLDLREAIAARLHLRPQEILIGNGSTELIHLTARAFSSGGQRCTIAGPTFGEYEAGARSAGGRVQEVRATEATGFRPDIPALRQALAGSALTFLCNPNNPTGAYLSREDVMALAEGYAGVLVIDEAYASFVDGAWDALDLIAGGKAALLRSMTKDYAIPGLRLGYLLAREDLIERVRRYQVTWSVNAGAIAAGLAALAEDAYLDTARALVRKNKALLVQGLRDLGLPVVEGTANFVLARVGDAAAMRRRLILQGLVVRDCASFGLPAYIRIAVRTEPDCLRLLEALGDIWH